MSERISPYGADKMRHYSAQPDGQNKTWSHYSLQFESGVQLKLSMDQVPYIVDLMARGLRVTWEPYEETLQGTIKLNSEKRIMTFHNPDSSCPPVRLVISEKDTKVLKRGSKK